jgi:hypothetical protein
MHVRNVYIQSNAVRGAVALRAGTDPRPDAEQLLLHPFRRVAAGLAGRGAGEQQGHVGLGVEFLASGAAQWVHSFPACDPLALQVGGVTSCVVVCCAVMCCDVMCCAVM